MPEAGDEIFENGYRLRVLTIEDLRVGRVSIERQTILEETPASDEKPGDDTPHGA
jgi:CBS domain containing-hemolysin-like protein